VSTSANALGPIYTYTICFGFAVQQAAAVQQIHNKLKHLQQIHNKSTANQISGIWISTSCGLIVVLQQWAIVSRDDYIIII